MRKILLTYQIRIVLIIAVLSLAAVVALLLSPVTAQTNTEVGQSDAIAVRIIPNPDHFSINRWYESQGFKGSPQSLKVDGYEALRDGRTIYVNAANAVPETNDLYTNIYLISHNQEPQNKTVDILAQIVSRWQFNENIKSNEIATCSLSAFQCESDADCTSLQACDLQTHTCVLKETRYCATDDDCPVNFFCDSTKAKIIRDINRVGKIEEIKEALAKYRQQNRSYPKLAAGSYLAGTSISVWPSWKENFLSSLKLKASIVDPINILGPCPNYNLKTCWDAANKKFYQSNNNSLVLPANSYAFMYSTNSAGSSYDLCAKLESTFSFQPEVEIGSCAEGSIGGSGLSANQAPEIINFNLNGIAGKEFNGFVLAHDPEGDPLTWDLITENQDWSGWSAPPILQGTGNSNQKRIYASQAGLAPGEQVITIVVKDNKGGESATTTKILLNPSASFVEAEDYIYRLSLDPNQPFYYNFQIAGEGGMPNFTLSPNGGADILALVDESITSSGVNRQRIMYQGTIPTSTSFLGDISTNYKLTVDSPNGSSATTNFNITVKTEKPSFNLDCAAKNRIGYNYYCLIGRRQQGFFSVNYTIDSELTPGLFLTENDTGEFYLHGKTTTLDEGRTMAIVATNDYGTKSVKELNLQVTSYCGDGFKQTPNTEGRGGVRNDGQEMCDGNEGIALNASESKSSRQYACNTPAGAITDYPINDTKHCIFKSPLDGGGYCGDTFCNLEHEGPEVCDLECCKFDCDPNYNGNFTPPTVPIIGPGCIFDYDCDPDFWCANIPGFCRPHYPDPQSECLNYDNDKVGCINLGETQTGMPLCNYYPSGSGDCVPIPIINPECTSDHDCGPYLWCANIPGFCRPHYPDSLSECLNYNNNRIGCINLGETQTGMPLCRYYSSGSGDCVPMNFSCTTNDDCYSVYECEGAISYCMSSSKAPEPPGGGGNPPPEDPCAKLPQSTCESLGCTWYIVPDSGMCNGPPPPSSS